MHELEKDVQYIAVERMQTCPLLQKALWGQEKNRALNKNKSLEDFPLRAK